MQNSLKPALPLLFLSRHIQLGVRRSCVPLCGADSPHVDSTPMQRLVMVPVRNTLLHVSCQCASGRGAHGVRPTLKSILVLEPYYDYALNPSLNLVRILTHTRSTNR